MLVKKIKTMEKIKRKCASCGKETLLNRYHGLDSKSMNEALRCKKCRKNK